MKIIPALGPMSGKVGGLVASHNRSGAYFRRLVTGVNPNTTRQQSVRSSFGGMVNNWLNLLTPAQRGAWNEYAANVAMTDRMGQQIYLTGQNHYIRSNTPRVQAGLALVNDAPTVFNTGETVVSWSDEQSPGDLINQVVLNDTNDELQMLLVFSGPLSETAILLSYMGNAVNSTVNFFKGPYQLFAVEPGATITDTTFPLNTELTDFMSAMPPTPGERRPVRFRLAFVDGRLSQPVERIGTVVTGSP